MSSTILTNWTVYYTGEGVNHSEYHIKWTGTSGTNTVLELYDALQDLFDASAQMDNGTPMSLQTPTAFTIGQIETNDPISWFIDPESIKHLTGGSITTTGWDFSSGTRQGIVKIPTTLVNILGDSSATPDTNYTATTSAGAQTGTVLFVDETENAIWLRPATNTTDWTGVNNTHTITVNGKTDNVSGNAVTGNSIWSNIFTIGTITSNPTLYISQDNATITNNVTYEKNQGSAAWWGTNQIDVLLLTTDQGTLIDNGLFNVYAREDYTLYDNFVVDASAGGRTPVPLATSLDANNPTPGETTANGITITFGNGTNAITADVNNDTTNEEYSIEIGCNSNPVLYVYEYLKSIVRDGQTTLYNTGGAIGGIQGQLFTGVAAKLDYSSIGSLVVGDKIRGNTSGATGIIAAIDTTGTYVTIHNYQGTFVAETATEVDGGGQTITISTVTTLDVDKVNPFGTFAGGTFFTAPGVLITGRLSTEANSYVVKDNTGTTYSEPTSVTFELTGIATGSEVRVYNDDLTTTRDTEINGTESLAGTTFSFNYTSSDSPDQITYTATSGLSYTVSRPVNITVVILDYNFKETRLSLTLNNVTQSIPVQQITERNYSGSGT